MISAITRSCPPQSGQSGQSGAERAECDIDFEHTLQALLPGQRRGGRGDRWLFGVSPEGIGFVFMWLALAVGIIVALVTQALPQDIQDLLEDIRVPGTRRSHGSADAGMAPLS